MKLIYVVTILMALPLLLTMGNYTVDAAPKDKNQDGGLESPRSFLLVPFLIIFVVVYSILVVGKTSENTLPLEHRARRALTLYGDDVDVDDDDEHDAGARLAPSEYDSVDEHSVHSVHDEEEDWSPLEKDANDGQASKHSPSQCGDDFVAVEPFDNAPASSDKKSEKDANKEQLELSDGALVVSDKTPEEFSDVVFVEKPPHSASAK